MAVLALLLVYTVAQAAAQAAGPSSLTECRTFYGQLHADSTAEIVNDKVVLPTHRKVKVGGRTEIEKDNSVKVISVDPETGARQERHYSRTNRGLENNSFGQKISDFYPAEFLTDDFFRGKKILDAGTGGGSFVTELSARGHQIKGIDIYLNEEQKKLPALFQLGDLKASPYADEEFDLIYSTWSVFSYDAMIQGADNAWKLNPKMNDYIAELARILKVNGKLFVSPLNLSDEAIAKLVEASGGKLQFKSFSVKTKNRNFGYEITRVK